MPKHDAPPEPVTVERQSELNKICADCKTRGRFAFDTEFVMEDRFEPDVCLVQIASDEHVAIIDPLCKMDLAPVWQLVHDKRVETVVHAGQEDLAISVQHSGVVPRNVYDVQIAAGMAGMDYPLSLQKLVQSTEHIRLHKSKTLTDWRRRPLTDAQIRYGAEDVCYLLRVKDKLHQRLAKMDRLSWVREEFNRLEDLSLYQRVVEEKLLRVKGSGSLRGRQLAILRELLTWREQAAASVDRPVRVLLKDHLLVEIAKHELSTVADLRDLRGLHLSERHARAVCRVVRKAKEIPKEQWPNPTPRDVESEAETALVSFVTGILRGFSLQNDISYALLASKKSVRELVRQFLNEPSASPRSKPDLLSGWRGEFVGAMLEGILSGDRTVRIEHQNGRANIRVGGKRKQRRTEAESEPRG